MNMHIYPRILKIIIASYTKQTEMKEENEEISTDILLH